MHKIVDNTADDVSLCSPQSVCTIVAGLVRVALRNGWTYASLGTASGLCPRRIKSWATEGKEPSLSGILSLVVVLGPNSVNIILSIIGYSGAHPLDESEDAKPSQIIATLISGLNTIAKAGDGNHFNHLQMPEVRGAADSMIATLVPISSAGAAV